MIQELLKRRKIAYKLFDWNDKDLDITIDHSDVISQTIHFFQTQSELIYPAKSYFVAIVYAKCLEQYFAQDFYKSLDDDQLIPDDPYFVPYSTDCQTYNIILDNISKDVLSYDSTKKTVEYFKKEFLVDVDLTKYGIDNKANWKM